MSAEIAYERHRLISGRGGATISVKEDAVILDDVGQGVALYKLSGPERVKTFPVPCEILRSRRLRKTISRQSAELVNTYRH